MKILTQALVAIAGALSLATSSLHAQQGAPPDPQMKAVLDTLASLGGEPIETLSPEEARKQPTPADAVKKVMKDQGKKGPEPVGDVNNTKVDLGDHNVDVRIGISLAGIGETTASAPSEALDEPLTKAQVLAIVRPFIVGSI